MSLKKAQTIANILEEELGFALTAYENSDLEFLKEKLEEFLALEIRTEELEDPEFMLLEDGVEFAPEAAAYDPEEEEDVDGE